MWAAIIIARWKEYGQQRKSTRQTYISSYEVETTDEETQTVHKQENLG
jgi:hypothetical protein